MDPLTNDQNAGEGRRDRRAFDTTRWTVVLAAGRDDEAARARSLAELCERYWYPLYSFVRRRGDSHADAQDLTQEFFHDLLRDDGFGKADRERGRFRTFLLNAMRNFLNEQHRKERSLKRGGGTATLPPDGDWDERFSKEPVDYDDPERLYARNWARALIDHCVRKLEVEERLQGRAGQFDFLKDFVGLPDVVPDGTFVENPLGKSPGALAQALFRMRRRFRAILREQVALTVTDDEDVDDELRALIRALQCPMPM